MTIYKSLGEHKNRRKKLSLVAGRATKGLRGICNSLSSAWAGMG